METVREHGMAEPGAKRTKRMATQAYRDKREKTRARRLKRLRFKPLQLPEYISVKGMAALLHVPAVLLVKIMIKLGIPPRSSDEYLIPEVVDILCKEFDRIPKRGHADKDIYPAPPLEPGEIHPPRPPIVTILGHVNHGKTTLLDTLRAEKKKVVDTEAGGITQHMGAFEIEVEGSSMVFLDTPGHAAFETMRERGVNMCDVAILVVDTTKGVQDQTLSSIQFLKRHNVPIVVALNKIDKKSAKIKATKKELVEIGKLELEDAGGDIPCVEISGLTGKGIDNLKEMVHLQASLLSLMAPRDCPAEMVVVESRVDPHKGVLAQGILTRGTLKKNDIFIVGRAFGKIKRIFQHGAMVDKAQPGSIIEVTGFESKEILPNPGSILLVVEDEKKARNCVAYREMVHQEIQKNATQLIEQERKMDEEETEGLEKLYATENGLDPEEFLKQRREERERTKPKRLPIMLKADVGGSIEAISKQIEKFPKDKINIYLAKTGLGPVTEADVKIAASAEPQCVILGFGVPLHPKAVNAATTFNVKIQHFKIIYSLLEWLAEYCAAHLPPEIQYEDIATAKVQQIFTRKGLKKLAIAGCLVTSGTIKRGGQVQVRRNGEVLFTSQIRQLRHEKTVAKEISAGQECGILLGDEFQFQPDDLLVMVESKTIKATFETAQYNPDEWKE